MVYILIIMLIIAYILLQKIKFDNMEVECYRAVDQCCYDVQLRNRKYSFDNGNLRSRRRKSTKVILTLEDVDDLENVDWKTKWKIWRNY